MDIARFFWTVFCTPLKLHRIIQSFDRPRVENIQETVHRELSCNVAIKEGASIAIAVGSRGIANISEMTKAVVDWVRTVGGIPFIVPAMGSHGGATAEGQAELLASYGITSESMGCPVRSTMEVVELDRGSLPHPLYMDRFTWESSGVIVINRIKPHTDFHGTYESGLAKMCVIGLGKERQAREMHSFGIHGLRDLVPEAARHVLNTGKILAGLAIVQNAYDETAHIEAVAARSIMTREPELLQMAKANMPSLPVTKLDVLMVDELGKNISGTGMDTNIIGRIRIAGEPEPAAPRIGSIVVSDLTPETHGNATGIGLADVITEALRAKIDFKTTYTNIVTSGFLERGKMPLVASSDRSAYEIALRGSGSREHAAARIIRIRDTLHLSKMLVSEAIVHEIGSRDNIQVVGGALEIFDANGKLLPF